MALNPQLVNVATAYGGRPTLFPQIFAGELVFGSREGSAFSMDGPRGYKYVLSAQGCTQLGNLIWRSNHIKRVAQPNVPLSLSPSRFSGGGTIFLTNYRLVFVPKKPTPAISAIELPILYIADEKVSQPIFGANNLTGVCTPVDSPPGSSERIKWKLSFTNGGMGTLVPLFYASIEYLRTTTRRRQQESAPAPAACMATAPPSFVQTAIVDPNDPTKVYLTQPVDLPQSAEKYPVC